MKEKEHACWTESEVLKAFKFYCPKDNLKHHLEEIGDRGTFGPKDILQVCEDLASPRNVIEMASRVLYTLKNRPLSS